MANSDNSGGDKLIERILNTAREEAGATKSAADEQINSIRTAAESDIQKINADAERRASEARESILERSRTNAELDSRKYALQAKRVLVDRAFAEALKRMNAMPQAERVSFISALALSEAAGGEAICPAGCDASLIGGLLDGLNAQLKSSGRAPLTLGEARADIDGGFVLKSTGYEKNCSFFAVLRDMREESESAVAAILFD